MKMKRSGRFWAGVALAMVAGFCGSGVISSARAQAPGAIGCDKLMTFLNERKGMVGKITEASKSEKKMDPQQACDAFGRLISNGNETLKWMAANKDWCHIPDQFITGMKADNGKALTIRGQACKAAAQVEAAKKNGGMPGQFGGNGLTGEMKIPSGAL